MQEYSRLAAYLVERIEEVDRQVAHTHRLDVLARFLFSVGVAALVATLAPDKWTGLVLFLLLARFFERILAASFVIQQRLERGNAEERKALYIRLLQEYHDR